MYCRNCGHEVDKDDTFCTNCGALIEKKPSNNNNNNNSNIASNDTEAEIKINPNINTFVDRGNPLIGICSFFIPVMGLILFLIWRKEKPRSAKHAGLGALVWACMFAFSLFILLVDILLY